MINQLDDLSEIVVELSRYGRVILWGPDNRGPKLFHNLWEASIKLYSIHPGASFEIRSDHKDSAIDAAADLYLKLQDAIGVQVEAQDVIRVRVEPTS